MHTRQPKAATANLITDVDRPQDRAALGKKIFELRTAIKKAKDKVDSPIEPLPGTPLGKATALLEKAEKAAMAEPWEVRKVAGTNIRSLLPMLENAVSALTDHSN